jgi:hypothetical protein
MDSSIRIAADILIAAVAATENRITAIDEKQAKELAEAYKIIHKAVEQCRDPSKK